MKRFYTADINGHTAHLDEEESHHCLQVLRVQDGEHVEITDGKGRLWLARVQRSGKKQAVLQLEQILREEKENPARCSLAVALTKNHDRMDWLMEKTTELGITDFYPLITQRTERSKLRLDRLEKIAVSAMKQSQRLWKPEIHEPVSLPALLPVVQQEAKFMAHCIENDSKKSIKDLYLPGSRGIILIGPEGDFTAQEIDLALANGFQPVSLGDARLRVETAALAACCWMNLSGYNL